jgi:hypothetical protein
LISNSRFFKKEKKTLLGDKFVNYFSIEVLPIIGLPYFKERECLFDKVYNRLGVLTLDRENPHEFRKAINKSG